MTRKKSKRKGLFIGLALFFIVLGIIVLSFFIYVGSYYKPTEHALSYLQDSETVTVKEEDDYISFVPKEENQENGFIFYPGGKVDSKAYAPIMFSLAEEGISSYLLKVPFHLAFFDISAADKVYSSKIQHWYVGGHSLGGAMASKYVSQHLDMYQGLILLASYSVDDMSTSSLRTLSFLGSNDQVLNHTRYDENKKNLANLTEVVIEGGIHSYFGDYGHQDGDGEASITCDEQISIVSSHVSSFILQKE